MLAVALTGCDAEGNPNETQLDAYNHNAHVFNGFAFDGVGSLSPSHNDLEDYWVIRTGPSLPAGNYTFTLTLDPGSGTVIALRELWPTSVTGSCPYGTAPCEFSTEIVLAPGGLYGMDIVSGGLDGQYKFHIRPHL